MGVEASTVKGFLGGELFTIDYDIYASVCVFGEGGSCPCRLPVLMLAPPRDSPVWKKGGKSGSDSPDGARRAPVWLVSREVEKVDVIMGTSLLEKI